MAFTAGDVVAGVDTRLAPHFPSSLPLSRPASALSIHANLLTQNAPPPLSPPGSIPHGDLDDDLEEDTDAALPALSDGGADMALDEGYRSSTPGPPGAATGGDRPPLPTVAEDGAGPLPPPPPHPLNLDGGGGAGSTGHPPHAASASTRSSTPPLPPRAAPPARWSDFWAHKRRIPVPSRSGAFVVYSTGATASPTTPVLFCCHGAGYTGMSWALLARHLRDTLHVVAYDARGHGETRTDDDGDLSAEAQAADAVAVWEALFKKEGSSPPPPTVLIGHAMGGMAATRAAASGGFGPSLAGLLLLDVVLWGGGGPAACHMISVAAGRPPSFSSYDAAADFAARSGRCRNPEAVSVSFASMLREETDEQGTRWVWRTPLHATSQFWEGWYESLTETFLGVACPKLLIFSHKRPLDRALAVAQAQGKVQVLNLAQASLAIQECEAGLVAGAVGDFLSHFRIVDKKGGGPGSRTSSGGGGAGGGGGGGGGMTAASPLRRRTSDVSGA